MSVVQSANVKWSSGHRILGLIFMAAGIFSILMPLFMEAPLSDNRSSWIGIVFILFGLPISTSFGGTEVNTSTRQFRSYRALLGIRWGNWQPLPAMDGLYTISLTGEIDYLPNGITPTLSGKVTDYYVMAVSADLKPLFYLSYPTEAQARKVAQELATGLGVPLKNQ